MKRIPHLLMLVLPSLLHPCSTVLAQGTAFTYQGRLNDGTSPANGRYDFEFRIFDAAAPGAGTSLGTPNPNSLSAVGVTNGLFTVILDFGNNPFAAGAPRWLEISVRTNGPGSFSTLDPRQALTATPYAITASNLTGVVSSAGLSGAYSGAVTFNNSGSSFSGNGSGLLNVNALTLGGLSSSDFWRATGNAGTVVGPNFLGTTDNQPFEIKVNNTRALRIDPTGGAPSLTGGYPENYAAGPGAVVAGGGTSGSINEADGMYAFVGAGHGSKAGHFSAVVGGAYNVSLSQFAFSGSGLANTNKGNYSVIVGGSNNLTAPLAANAFIGGGNNNTANNTHATIGGGDYNVASSWSTVSGGEANQSLAEFCTVAGGRFNQSAGTYASVGGGYNNISTGDHATVAGGFSNASGSTDSAVGGGSNNSILANSDGSVIGGGQQNSIGSNTGTATIAGGLVNTIESGSGFSSIAGGTGNLIQGGAIYCAIGGGYFNTIQINAANALIGGGHDNTIESAWHSTIGGGGLNVIQTNAYDSTIAGGGYNTIQAGAHSSAIGGGDNNIIQASSTLSSIGGGEQNNIGTNSGASTISGGWYNAVESNAGSSSIAGGNGNRIQTGAVYGDIGGGYANIIQNNSDYSVIAGGGANTVVLGASASAIGGGVNNTASGNAATIPGGNANVASGDSSLAAGSYSTASGFISTALGEGVVASGRAAVAIGSFTAATNPFSMAAGREAQANHSGSFVWADSQDAAFASTADNQFSIRAAGGVRLNTDTSMFFGNQTRQMLNLWGAEYGVGVQASTEYFRTSSGFSWFKGGLHNDGQNNPGTGGTEMMRLNSGGLTVNGTFVSASDRNRKENFQPVSSGEVLVKVAALPVTRWNYKDDTGTTHIGPMAQDFFAAFGVGPDDKHIATVDADGVALAAIQGLNEKLETRSQMSEDGIQKLKEENAELKVRLEKLERLMLNQKPN
ncbi:MAG TPA: tail fiber domain-containing protein [Candidatus Acidoferrum sp.]|nr:tail fiber domain-containing protein [Candidatus Acidoferrum sp.]